MFTRVASDREGPDSITGDPLYFVLEQLVHQKKEVKKEENFRREWVDTVDGAGGTAASLLFPSYLESIVSTDRFHSDVTVILDNLLFITADQNIGSFQ